MQFKPHSEKQDRAIFSPAQILALCTGIQFGKTQVGAMRMKIATHKYTDQNDNFIIAAPTYKIMRQATLPAFLSIMDGYGEYKAGDALFKVNGGGTVWFRTGTEPDSIVGIPSVRHLWLDEAGKLSLYFWENAQARAAFCQAPIDLTTSPYTMNWLYKEIIQPKIKDPSNRPDVELIQARSDENPYFPKKRIEDARRTMDPRRFNALFGGEWESPAGLVYDCFNGEENSCEPMTLPLGTKFYAGVDWGTTAPFALVVRAITPDGYHYQVSEYYKTGLTITDMVLIAKQKLVSFGIQMFYCDPSAKGYIEEFCRQGLPAVGANNDIRLGIDRHYELLKTRKLKLFRGRNKFTIDEYESYHYPEDDDNIEPNRDIKDRLPVKQNDHAMDANRYVTVETYHGHDLRPPHTNDEARKSETQFERIERLKYVIPTGDDGHSEDFS